MKNLKGIILLFIANSISTIAQGISMIAIPWYFVQEEMFPTYTKFFIFANVVVLFWVPYCGVIIDKYNRKNIFLVANLISAIILLSVAYYGYANGGLPWLFVASIFGMTFMNYNIHYPNLYAFVQEITEPHQYGKITSYLEIQGQLSSMLAGAASAILLEGIEKGPQKLLGLNINIPFTIEAWNIEDIFLMDGITYVISFIIISFISYQALKDSKSETGSILSRLKSGIAYFKKYPEIFIFGVASYCIFVVVILEGFLLGAKYVDAHLQGGGDMYAFSDVCYSVGAFLAGVCINTVFRRVKAPSALIILTIMTAALFFILFATKNALFLYAMLFVLGLTNAGGRIIRTTFLFKKIPNHVFGRAASLFNMSNITFRIIFVSAFSLAYFDEANNIIYAFLILSVFLVLAAIVLISNKRAVINSKSTS